MLLVWAVLVLLLLAAGAVADDSLPFTCRAERAQLDVNMRQSEERIDSAWVADDPVGKCVAVRIHIEVLRSAADVYTRCTMGRERDESRGRALDSLADFQDIAEEINCP
jgi:hypothetical protein